MAKNYFTREELRQWACEGNVGGLLTAGLLQIEQLERRSSQLTEARARIAQLEKELDQERRQNARQAAPFRVPAEKRAGEPKKPGRKAGHPGACRPRPGQIDEDIAVPLENCPQCGSRQWLDQIELEQFIEEIPVFRPRVTRLRTYQASCACCGHAASSRHPMQVSQASGAAAVHLGSRALAIATDLNKAKGLTMRKTCAVLRDHFGLKLSPGGLSQAMTRVAGTLQPQYEALRQQMLKAPVVHADETSWWVGGESSWLWVFTHDQGTFYVVDKSRGRDVLQGVLGESFPGVLVSDCLSIYDLDEGAQQKCYSHHLKAISKARQVHPQQGAGYLTEFAELLRRAIAIGKDRTACPPEDLAQKRQQLESQADTLLATPRDEPSEESVRNRILKQRDHLFTFLDHEGVDATNNLAERQLRPAVIARKLSCGNKTTSGANTYQILASLAATSSQTGHPFIDLVSKSVRLSSAESG